MSVWDWGTPFPAPAKLNLFLHVVGRRPDGYHLLQTLFRFIDLHDTLRFSPRADGAVRLKGEAGAWAAADDLCVRAALALKQAGGCRQGVDIELQKRIPVGGGLGGGSSDAATTLLALNHLWELGLRRDELLAIGLQLGADVPVFLGGRNAFAQGIGEVLEPVQLPAAWYVVLVPREAVSTASIFAAPELTRNTKIVTISGFSDTLGHYQAGFGHNDLEPVVYQRHPQVARCLKWLRTEANGRLSGSGGCVFAELTTEREARSVLSKVPGDMRGLAVRGLDEHPLRGRFGTI